MFNTIYYEKDLEESLSLSALKNRFNKSTFIPCEHYGQIFNRKNQNFRLQKQDPSLILSKKQGTFLHSCPEGYDIGRPHNYYFSHLLNCPFDCRYCYLQGFFNSAHLVWFINHEDFFSQIHKLASSLPENSLTIFTGYDCDSLGLDGLTRFFSTYHSLFESLPSVEFELRTKSMAIMPLLKNPLLNNVIPAFSISPPKIQALLENKTASISKRIQSLQKLQNYGYRIGLRIDPMIWTPDWESLYSDLFETLQMHIDLSKLHSVTIGTMRFPKHLYKTIQQLYPDEPLFHLPLSSNEAFFSYNSSRSIEMTTYTKNFFSNFLGKEKVFICN